MVIDVPADLYAALLHRWGSHDAIPWEKALALGMAALVDTPPTPEGRGGVGEVDTERPAR